MEKDGTLKGKEIVVGGASISHGLSVGAGIVTALLASWMVVAARRS